MRRAGEVVRTAGGLAILRAAGSDPPAIGTATVDERLTSVGRIVDVFGPVDRPYLAVSPDDSTPASLLGAVLYLE